MKEKAKQFNPLGENACRTCKHIDMDGKEPCKSCGDETPYDEYEPLKNGHGFNSFCSILISIL